MHPNHQGLLAVHSAVFIFGFTALFSKLIQLPALEINLLRSLFAAFALWAVIRLSGESLTLRSSRDYGVVLLLGLLLGGHWVTYFHAMQVATIAIGVIALYTFPVMTVFLEPLVHGGRPQIIDIMSGIAMLFGIYLLVPEFRLDNATTQGVFWGMLSALLFALRNIIQRRYFYDYPAKQALFYQILITVIVLFPFGFQIIPEVSTYQWGQLMLLGIVFTALPHTLFAFSLRHFKAKSASLVACLQVVYATLFAAVLLNEWPSLVTLIGGAIVVAAAIFETWMVGRRQQVS